MNFVKLYNSNYKKLLLIPTILLILAISYLIVFYAQTGDIFHKDVSLTGGTSITIQTQIEKTQIEKTLSQKFDDYTITTVSDNSGNQIQIIITTKEEHSENIQNTLEEALNIKLTEENSSIETTSASLSKDFYKQLIIAIILAFFWMAAVVFIIFASGWKIKILTIIANILFAIFLGNFFLTINPIISTIIFSIFVISLIYTYIKNSVPAFAVMLSAFADIVMTLAIVNLVGMKLSTAGIVAFLMLIGYSVDTDILLTTRALKTKESINKTLFGAFKTGMTMGLTSIIAITTALIVVYPFASVLNQIFTILLIGLLFDLFNTWITNASIIKWYMEKQ